MNKTFEFSRRDLLIQGSASLAGLALFRSPLFAQIFPGQSDEEIVPFLDQPPEPPRPDMNLLNWEQWDSWITPNERFFRVGHYNTPVIDRRNWKLEVGGLVSRPRTYTLDELMARPRQEVIFTLECSGNHGFPWFLGGIGTARWEGTPLASLLAEAGVLPKGIEVIFVGSDQGQEEIRGNKVEQNFARSMSLEDAMNPNNLLCYRMNGEALPGAHGFPLRLIAPGWYGIANVKWLKRIEVRETRFMGRFMARDYVTLREEPRGEESAWMEMSVGRTLLKSFPARVTRKNSRYRIYGAAWGAPIERVEVRLDGGGWLPARIDRSQEAEFAWKIWYLDWDSPSPGEHTIVSRAIDTEGNIQPAMDDARIAGKRTYWESNGQVTRRIRIS